MKKSTTRRAWKRLKETWAAQAEALALKLSGGRFPIPLEQFALERKVTSVKFRPLLVDGVLAFRPPGFAIYIGCLSSEASDLEARFSKHSKRPLPNRVRFTLAHELAHTYLFQLTEKEARPVFDSTEIELDTIEPFCNSVAARILLPREAIRPLLTSRDLLNPSHLRQISNEADVSPEALIYRLSPISEWVNEIALVGTFVIRSGTPSIRAVSYHSKLGDYFLSLKQKRPGADLLPALATTGKPVSLVEKALTLPITIGDTPFFQEFVASSEAPRSDTAIGQYFFSVYRKGDPTPRGRA